MDFCSDGVLDGDWGYLLACVVAEKNPHGFESSCIISCRIIVLLPCLLSSLSTVRDYLLFCFFAFAFLFLSFFLLSLFLKSDIPALHTSTYFSRKESKSAGATTVEILIFEPRFSDDLPFVARKRMGWGPVVSVGAAALQRKTSKRLGNAEAKTDWEESWGSGDDEAVSEGWVSRFCVR